MGLPWWFSAKESAWDAEMQDTWVPWVGKILWRRVWPPTLIFLPGDSHGQRSSASYSPRGRKEMDMTEWAQAPSMSVCVYIYVSGFSCSSVGKEAACSAGDPGSIPGLGRSPGEGNGNPLQYPYLENLMDRGAWWATVHGVAKSQAWLRD